jgi:hypothetical protein
MDKKTALFVIVFCVILIALLYLAKFFRTQYNKKKGKEILKLYNHKDLKSVEVKISETLYSPYSNRGGTLGFLNTTMYYSENILIFTQSENSNFEEFNYTLPLVVNPKNVKDLFIKSDEYILYIGNSNSGKIIQIYSEKENDLLKVIFNNLKTSILRI